MNRAGPWSVVTVTVDSLTPARTAAGFPIVAHSDWIRIFLGRAFAPSAIVGGVDQPTSVEYLVLGRHADLLPDENARSGAALAAASDFEALAKIVAHHRDSIAAARSGGIRARPELFIGGYAVLRRVTVSKDPKDWVVTDEGLSIVGWGLEGEGRRPVLAMDPAEIRELRDRVLEMHSLPCPRVGPTVGDRAVRRVLDAESMLERGTAQIDGASAPTPQSSTPVRAAAPASSGPAAPPRPSARVARRAAVAAVVGVLAALVIGVLAVVAVIRFRADAAKVAELEASVSSMQEGSVAAVARSREFEEQLKSIGPLRTTSRLVAEVKRENDDGARRLLDARLRDLEPAKRAFPGIEELGVAALEALDRLSKCSEQVKALQANREALEGRLEASSSTADEAREARSRSFRVAVDAVRQLPPGDARAAAIESLSALAVGPEEVAAVRSAREAARSPASAPAVPPTPAPRKGPSAPVNDVPAAPSTRVPTESAPVPGTIEDVVSRSWLPADRGADAVSRASASLADALDAAKHAGSAERVRECLEAGPGWAARLNRELTRVGESFPDTDSWKAFRKQVAALAGDPGAGSVGDCLRVLESLQDVIRSTDQLSRTATGGFPGLALIASTALLAIGEAMPECGGLRASVLGSQGVLGGLQSLPREAEPSAVEARKDECLRRLKAKEWRQLYENGLRDRLGPWSVARTRVGELVAGTAGASFRLRQGIQLPKADCPVYFFDDAAPEAFREAGFLKADGSFVPAPNVKLPASPELALFRDADRATRP